MLTNDKAKQYFAEGRKQLQSEVESRRIALGNAALDHLMQNENSDRVDRLQGEVEAAKAALERHEAAYDAWKARQK